MLNKLLILKEPISKQVLSETLLKYLEPLEKTEVAEVFQFMLIKYRKKGLIRANGHPAEIHPIQVAKILDFNAHLMKVALIHDILEDIPNNKEEKNKLIEEIKHEFGREVIKAVLELTNEKKQDYVKNIKRLDSIIVKQADALNNIRTSTSKKLVYLKYGLPKKIDVILKHLSNFNIKDNSLYDLAFYKYYAKIIEEFFRTYEAQIKNLREQHKEYHSEIKFLEEILAKFTKQYFKVRKEIYKKFIQGMKKEELQVKNHIKIELLKRTKEALITTMPLNSLLVSIDQNIFLYQQTKETEKKLSEGLLNAIEQQIKAARLESFRLQHYYNIIIQNMNLIKEDFDDEIESPFAKIKALEEASKKIEYYARITRNVRQ